MKLYLHMRENGVTALGPGTRFGVWVAGCNRNCPGCIAQSTHDMKSGDPIDTGALAWEIITSNADGITVSGGEPFLQAEALAEMLRIVRGKRDMGVIVYTGYTLEELAVVPHADELLAQTDLLVDGPYVQELDDGKSLRGSSNQRVHLLTPRYAEHLHRYGAEGREAQVFYHGAKTHRVGIPTDNKYTY